MANTAGMESNANTISVVASNNHHHKQHGEMFFTINHFCEFTLAVFMCKRNISFSEIYIPTFFSGSNSFSLLIKNILIPVYNKKDTKIYNIQ